MTNFVFSKATKKRSKARIAIDGPSGSGKTYTALIAATVLANGGKVAVIDTERGSASLYSDKFAFDVLELDNFSPDLYTRAIHAAEEAGYSVIVIDSLTHAWEGEGGALDMVDKAAARVQGNSYVAWRDVTPLHRGMVDAMLQSPCHIIATMRSKMDYVQEKDERTGKTAIRKVGMAPIQRQGMEYEFTLVGDMDIDHKFIVSKSRCAVLADAVVSKPDGVFFKRFLDWLNEGEEVKPAPKPTPTPVVTSSPADNGHEPASDGDMRAMLANMAKHSPTATNDEVQHLAAYLDGILKDRDYRLQFLSWLQGKNIQTAKDLDKHLTRALHDWIDITYDKNVGAFIAGNLDAEKAIISTHVELLKAAGQESLL